MNIIYYLAVSNSAALLLTNFKTVLLIFQWILSILSANYKMIHRIFLNILFILIPRKLFWRFQIQLYFIILIFQLYLRILLFFLSLSCNPL